MSTTFTTYHSRSEKNAFDILENGFQEKFIGKKGGFGLIFGKGVYTSTNLKYVCTYHPDCDKILVCEINTDNFKKMTSKEYTKLRKKDREELESYDLLIIEDLDEYVCKDLNKIKVKEMIKVKKIFENNLLISFNVI
jgi:hypothetical protein